MSRTPGAAVASNPARILLADDDSSHRTVVAGYMKRAGFDVLEARNGKETLDYAVRAMPDAVVLEINLPDIRGHEVCQKLKTDPRMSSVPVVHLATSYTQNDQALLRSGADAYLNKPVEPQALVASIESLLRLRKAEAQLQEKVQLHRAVIDTLPGEIAIVSEEGLILDANRAWLEAIPEVDGLPRGAVGSSYIEALDAAARKGNASARELLAALNGLSQLPAAKRGSFTHEAIEATLPPRHFLVRIDALRDLNRALLMVTRVDISELRRAQKAEAQAREASIQFERRQQELAVMRSLSRAPQPLISAMSQEFERWVREFAQSLEMAGERRLFKVERPITAQLQRITGQMGGLGAGPQDIVDVYGAALKQVLSRVPREKFDLYVEEGRMLLLEAMGLLALTYRQQQGLQLNLEKACRSAAKCGRPGER
ncbi:MAG TPA: response regulator [Planctomycetota bacterium]|nr:response regulator [Planctomycetota bacterium]